METINLDKNLIEILNNKYIVPLYQRNFAWSEDEISRLLQDIYENFEKDPNSKYYIGSLIVLKRKNGDFEVIDGQQRLTAVTLISKALGVEEIKEPKLFYDSRPEVEAFFNSFYRTSNTNDVTFDHKVSHLIKAVDIINETKLKITEEKNVTIKSVEKTFNKYFAEKVILVRVEIPEDTDVANYFEIMNNRGEQLQKHEILKAKLMSKISSYDDRMRFARIWDACSQMDTHIQKLFIANDRRNYFGDDYNSFNNQVFIIKSNDCDENFTKSRSSIDSILAHRETGENNIIEAFESEDIEDDVDNKSIIDFPNFLMHVFKLEFNDNYKNSTKSGNNESGLEIPLNEKDLLTVFSKIERDIDSMVFIAKLLYYRTIFDRYIVKATRDEKSEDDYSWTLKMPFKYTYEKKNTISLSYKNAFDNQERIVKCLSMLQVTFRARIYKNWLQEVLSWFSNVDNFNITCDVYQKKIDDLACRYFNENIEYKGITKDSYYSKGTNTPHYLFNFIDYLYWVKSQKDEKSKRRFNFDFKYRNSVEHHRPQSRKQGIDDILINCLGNLCLVSKNSNSKMNNEEPSGKAITYYSDKLPPKRKIMYEETKNSSSELKWCKVEIETHYKDVVDLLNERHEILDQ